MFYPFIRITSTVMSGEGGYCNLKGLEHRYHTLRAQLDELGFRQPLAIDCLPLVEALFADLLHTTSSLEHYKKQAFELTEVSEISIVVISDYYLRKLRILQVFVSGITEERTFSWEIL